MCKRAIASAALRASLPATVLTLACLTAGSPAVAQSRYDGSWSVVISTHRGACQSGLRYGVQIINGQVVGAAGGADVRGSVSRGGAVRVSVQSGGQWAAGSGRLSATHGGGAWRGQGNAGACSGTWAAQRVAQTAEAGPPRGRFYNYAPGYGPRYYQPAPPGRPAYYHAPRY
jgi:hypothetical protein